MTTITINPKLKADTFELGQLNEQTLLLMNNSLVPWFIILPNTQETELFKLDKAERAKLDKNIDSLSGLLVNHFKTDKLNIATIGNIVSQMHVHIIGRSVDDAFWPGVVWGRVEKTEYKKEEVERLIQLLLQEFTNHFCKAHI